jgi:hypothetical protein
LVQKARQQRERHIVSLHKLNDSVQAAHLAKLVDQAALEAILLNKLLFAPRPFEENFLAEFCKQVFGAFADSKQLAENLVHFVAAHGQSCLDVHTDQFWALLRLFEGLHEERKDLIPFEGHFKHKLDEAEDRGQVVLLNYLVHGQNGVDIEEESATQELGALKACVEAAKV